MSLTSRPGFELTGSARILLDFDDLYERLHPDREADPAMCSTVNSYDTSRDDPYSCRADREQSPFSTTSLYDELPVVVTDELGMVVDHEKKSASSSRVVPVKHTPEASKGRARREHVSKHFKVKKRRARTEHQDVDDLVKSDSEASVTPVSIRPKRMRRLKREGSTAAVQLPKTFLDTAAAVQNALNNFHEALDALGNIAGLSRPSPRIVYVLNIDELSSDSSLTDVPSDIGDNPFPNLDSQSAIIAVKSKSKGSKQRQATKSPYFPTPHRHRAHFLSTLPFPPLHHKTFGLMQERLAHRPFELLIATIFLNKTPGERAMPVFYELMTRYPTPAALADAKVEDVTAIIHKLGFQNQRARKCVAMAQAWVKSPPAKGKRMRKLNYPTKGDGKDVGVEETIPDEDPRVAWEISHLPGLGPYSHDSWRMFCRDELRGVSKDWLGEGATNEQHESEWRRVVPMDKELRAWCTWMWLKEGWVWDRETGVRTKASDKLMELAKGGGVVLEDKNQGPLIVQGVVQEGVKFGEAVGKIERPAGEYMAEEM